MMVKNYLIRDDDASESKSDCFGPFKKKVKADEALPFQPESAKSPKSKPFPPPIETKAEEIPESESESSELSEEIPKTNLESPAIPKQKISQGVKPFSNIPPSSEFGQAWVERAEKWKKQTAEFKQMARSKQAEKDLYAKEMERWLKNPVGPRPLSPEERALAPVGPVEKVLTPAEIREKEIKDIAEAREKEIKDIAKNREREIKEAGENRLAEMIAHAKATEAEMRNASKEVWDKARAIAQKLGKGASKVLKEMYKAMAPPESQADANGRFDFSKYENAPQQTKDQLIRAIFEGLISELAKINATLQDYEAMAISRLSQAQNYNQFKDLRISTNTLIEKFREFSSKIPTLTTSFKPEQTLFQTELEHIDTRINAIEGLVNKEIASEGIITEKKSRKQDIAIDVAPARAGKHMMTLEEIIQSLPTAPDPKDIAEDYLQNTTWTFGRFAGKDFSAGEKQVLLALLTLYNLPRQASSNDPHNPSDPIPIYRKTSRGDYFYYWGGIGIITLIDKHSPSQDQERKKFKNLYPFINSFIGKITQPDLRVALWDLCQKRILFIHKHEYVSRDTNENWSKFFVYFTPDILKYMLKDKRAIFNFSRIYDDVNNQRGIDEIYLTKDLEENKVLLKVPAIETRKAKATEKKARKTGAKRGRKPKTPPAPTDGGAKYNFQLVEEHDPAQYLQLDLPRPPSAKTFLNVPFVANGFPNSCSETSAEMVLRYWGVEKFKLDAGERKSPLYMPLNQFTIHNRGYETFEGGIAEGDLGLVNMFKYEDFIDKDGNPVVFDVKEFSGAPLNDLKQYLDRGIPAIIRIQTNSKGDKHTIVIIGYNEEGFWKNDNDAGAALFVPLKTMKEQWTGSFIILKKITKKRDNDA